MLRRFFVFSFHPSLLKWVLIRNLAADDANIRYAHMVWAVSIWMRLRHTTFPGSYDWLILRAHYTNSERCSILPFTTDKKKIPFHLMLIDCNNWLTWGLYCYNIFKMHSAVAPTISLPTQQPTHNNGFFYEWF